MPFGAYETVAAHEILDEKINMIHHFDLYLQDCQDQQLAHLIRKHRESAIQGYNQLVSYTHDTHSASPQSTSQAMPSVQVSQIQYGLDHPAQQSPHLQGRLNEDQIASAVLSCHKNSAKNHMAASVECADPNLRQMLINSAVTCANEAYEVFMYMNQKGTYQIPTMKDHTAKTYLHAFQPAQASQGHQSTYPAYPTTTSPSYRYTNEPH
ncbi:spore coat protein [Marinicrinis sediminis]|uniref:Spore coat protein n=1 Tax=Marinicrinis sediminis TaxID=1652465 RepID=A0ABW5R878_9BACL